MALQSTTDPVWQLTLNFDGNENGWSERLYLPTGSSPPVALATLICQYRLLCLSPDCKLVWAKVSQVGNPRDARACLLSFPVVGGYTGVLTGSPPVPIAGTNTTDNDQDSVMIRIETAQGRWANRWLHGIPDIQVSQGNLLAAIQELNGPAPALGTLPGANLWPALVGIYLRVVQDMTVFFKAVTTGDSKVYYTDTIASVIPRKMGLHKVGRFFGQSVGRAPMR